MAIEPSLLALTRKYNCDKKICRKAFSQPGGNNDDEYPSSVPNKCKPIIDRYNFSYT